MTVNPSRTRELNINRLILRAAQLAGLLNQSQSAPEDLLAFGRDLLELILDGLEAEGLRARAVEFEYLTLVAGQNAYALADDVIDVVGDGMYIDPQQVNLEQTQGEIPVIPMLRDEWQLLAAKDATGSPSRYYCHRTSTPPELRVWPVPIATTAGKLRLQVHRLAANSNDGNATVDLERFWGQYIQWELAHQLAAANSLNMGRVNYFGSVAKQKLETCKSYSAQKAPNQMVLSHRTGWT